MARREVDLMASYLIRYRARLLCKGHLKQTPTKSRSASAIISLMLFAMYDLRAKFTGEKT